MNIWVTSAILLAYASKRHFFLEMVLQVGFIFYFIQFINSYFFCF